MGQQVHIVEKPVSLFITDTEQPGWEVVYAWSPPWAVEGLTKQPPLTETWGEAPPFQTQDYASVKGVVLPGHPCDARQGL